MRKRLLLLGGLLLAQQASGVTIINTDSAASGGQAVSQHRSAPPLPASEQPDYVEQERSAPPLPNASAGISNPAQGLQWQNEEGEAIEESPRQAPPKPQAAQESPAAGSDTQAEGSDEQTKASSVATESSERATDSVKASSRFTVKQGWLSDAIDTLAYRAGYEMMWDVGQDGKADFQIHRDFTLTAGNAQEALGQVVEPFPIRLCLFQVDKIAKVIPENQECQ